MKILVRAGIISLACVLAILGEQTIPVAEAAKHVGEHATVCGVVASARYAPRSKGQPTFLNLDEPYPNAVFTALIWGEDRSKFDQPEVKLLDKRICTTGTINKYRGVPEVVLREPSQNQVEWICPKS